MNNSNLANYTKISPNSNNPRNKPITKITIHHMAGILSVEQCGNIFADKNRGASSNYSVGSDGRIGMYVEEKNRSWCSSSPDNDNQAVTIEVSNDRVGSDWHVSDLCLNKLIVLCTDICKRNGIQKLNYTGDEHGNLTRHNMFTATACPGPYLQSQFPIIAEIVNKRLNPPVAPKPPAAKPTVKPVLKVGGKVIIISETAVYGGSSKGIKIGKVYKNKPYVVEKIGKGTTAGLVLLKELYSWVYIKDLKIL